MEKKPLNWHFFNDQSSLTDGEYNSLVLHALMQLSKTAKAKLQKTELEEPFFLRLSDQKAFYNDQLKALKDSIQRFKYDHNVLPDDDDEEAEEKQIFSGV
jgi:alpha/beta superfamily hydrolase